MLRASDIPYFDVPVEEMILAMHRMREAIGVSASTTHHQFYQTLAPIVSSEEHRKVRSGCQLVERWLEREFERIQQQGCAGARNPGTSVAAVLTQSCDQYVAHLRSNSSKIAGLLKPFLQRATCILVHGFSRVIGDALVEASGNRRLLVYITETLPFRFGYEMAQYIRERLVVDESGHQKGGLELTVVPDTSVAALLPNVTFVLSGATAVTMNGGIVNTLGTLQVALLAKAMGRDFFVVTQTFKFTRCFPLRTSDISPLLTGEDSERLLRAVGNGEIPLVDLTPPEYIKMLFTELGVFPPATASDELYNIFQGG